MQTAHFPRRPPPEITHDTRVDWRRNLPAEWRDSVIEAFEFAEHREYEMPACRWFGYDIDGHPCYYAHQYRVERSCSDDDESFYQAVAYGETVHAWRLRDERWLIHRIIQTSEEGEPGKGFYTFAEHPPC